MFAAHNVLLTGGAVAPVTYKNAAAAASTSVAIPSHNVGDLIVVYTQCSYTTTITKPSASGTVPTWTDIDVSNGTYQNVRTAYAVATATNTTTGTWTNAQTIIVVVISGQGSSPLGSRSYSQQSTTSITCPAVTLTKTNGSSLLMHFAVMETGAYFTSSFSQSGYTGRLVPTGSGAKWRLFTKDDTTTDGQVTAGSGTTNPDSRSATIEIVA